MTNPIIKLVNAETGEVIERNMTAEELTQWQIDQDIYIAKQAAEESKATAKVALLDRLGITAEEAALLLGGN